MTKQQEFLRDAAKELGLTQEGMAERMKAPPTTFKKWLLPASSENYREMPEIAWQLVREILTNEKLKKTQHEASRTSDQLNNHGHSASHKHST